MKKLVVIAVIAVLVFVGWWYAGSFKISITALEGKLEPVTRGDLTIPITASGTVKPASRTEIKSKASGEIIRIPFNPGDMVHKGDLLVELKRDDEERSYGLKKADYEKAAANLEKAKILYEQRKDNLPIEVDIAEARVDSAKAQEKQAKANWEHIRSLHEDVKKEQESVLTEAMYDEAVANRRLAEAQHRQALIGEHNIAVAEQEVKLAQQAVNSAKIALEDAEERLSETRVLSPIDGMISEIPENIRVGMIIQSGKTSLTGGTVLMYIADISDLYVVAEVDEADIGTVRQIAPPSARPGRKRVATSQPAPAAQPAPTPNPASNPASTSNPAPPLEAGTVVEVTSDAFRTEEDDFEVFEGVIERILPEPKKRQAIVTYDVKIRLTSLNRTKLFLGMQADVEFVTESIKNALLIPRDALRTEPGGERLGVYVPAKKKNGSGKEPKFIPLRTGVTDGFVTEVLDEGKIKQGDLIYTKLPIKTRQQRERERREREREDEE